MFAQLCAGDKMHCPDFQFGAVASTLGATRCGHVDIAANALHELNRCFVLYRCDVTELTGMRDSQCTLLDVADRALQMLEIR
jgi:hypothetical protein